MTENIYLPQLRAAALNRYEWILKRWNSGCDSKARVEDANFYASETGHFEAGFGFYLSPKQLMKQTLTPQPKWCRVKIKVRTPKTHYKPHTTAKMV